jgi:hypothetical protein
MVPAPDRRKTGALERHFQTFLLSVGTAAVLAVAAAVWYGQNTLGRFDERLSAMARDLNGLSGAVQAQVANGETKAEHQADMNAVDERLDDHEERLRDLEDGKRISASTRDARR